MNVKTRCPECKTEYPLVPAVLQATRGIARCAQCGHVFNAFDYRVSSRDDRFATGNISPSEPRRTMGNTPDATVHSRDSRSDANMQPMFTEDVTRHPLNGKLGARLWQIPVLILLGLLLLVQILWMNRATLLGLAVTQPLCEWIDCSIAEKRAPESFQVIEREIRHDPFQQDVLHFKLRFRNDASFAQPLPELLLHLFDNNEYLVARRRLSPHEYLPKNPTAGVKVQPREIINIELAFMDPGVHASGFKIDFF